MDKNISKLILYGLSIFLFMKIDASADILHDIKQDTGIQKKIMDLFDGGKQSLPEIKILISNGNDTERMIGYASYFKINSADTDILIAAVRDRNFQIATIAFLFAQETDSSIIPILRNEINKDSPYDSYIFDEIVESMRPKIISRKKRDYIKVNFWEGGYLTVAINRFYPHINNFLLSADTDTKLKLELFRYLCDTNHPNVFGLFLKLFADQTFSFGEKSSICYELKHLVEYEGLKLSKRQKGSLNEIMDTLDIHSPHYEILTYVLKNG